MARFDTAFDAAGIEPTTAYEILPAGKYRARSSRARCASRRTGWGSISG
ncbi:MAG: hypothetical protein JKP98_09865 [Rhodobacteraceae bacterium]|nr:hypothetical protein [Paracoccaceae bacterium]